MPGVLIVEALAQTGAVAILSVEGNKGKTAYFGAMNNVKFKKKAVPGDKLRLECEIINQKDRSVLERRSLPWTAKSRYLRNSHL